MLVASYWSIQFESVQRYGEKKDDMPHVGDIAYACLSQTPG